MYIVGQKEADAAAQVLVSGKVFRYGIGRESVKRQPRYSEYKLAPSPDHPYQTHLNSHSIGRKK